MAATATERGRDQEKFYTVYRGGYSGLRTRSYIRVGKTHAARLLLKRNGIALTKRSVFDYGFGPGSFFLICGRDCSLAGLELDGENVAAVRKLLAERGYERVDLDAIEADRLSEHPLLERSYDLVVLSHVLEHLDEPEPLLRRLADCLAADGAVLGLLPLNEITRDEDHKRACDRDTVDRWAAQAGCEIADYVELDHFFYWVLPVVQAKSRIGRFAAQGLGLGAGLAASLFSPEFWFRMGSWFGSLTRSKPTQAVFLLRRKGS